MSQMPSLASLDPAAPQLTQKRKAAIIVRILMQEGAELSLSDLPEALQEELTHEMGALRQIDHTSLGEVIEEFLAELDAVGMTFPGGLAGALDALDGSISASTAARIRKQAGVPVHRDPWGMIGGLDAARLLEVIDAESEEVAAVVLSKLPVQKSAEILGQMDGARARRIAYAISQTSAIDPETVQTIGSAIALQLSSRPVAAFTDGPVQRVGAILNSTPALTRDGVLEGLEEKDAGFAEEVRKAIFTFGNIPTRIDPRDIPKITRAVDQAVLVTAIGGGQGADAKAGEFILSNMSQRMAQQLRDEINDAGKIKAKDAEEAMSAIVGAIREMESAGELLLLSDGEDDA
ncbi:flagellar motor switch protein FliG [Mangrovicoccus algicola]|uniref:Flagellar motor switch protein FliG n=1 Tax=Mangrovicoccus algicola TaxID=2771008 RepID=A0A8J6YT18_9RHOB|nr:FliG C-terminal domain-containing protein [Mangrovicoccus algicola]MBE3637090.1 flagellar motor switch protein FliG [Mangrovicoccus algicola]